MVTAICTSFDRSDLLEKTLRSFFSTDPPIKEVIVIDDSGKVGCNDAVCERYGVKAIYNTKRQGQIVSIDLAYSLVKTPYIFHMEEDWQFLRAGFIEQSMTLLEDFPDMALVWLLGDERPLHIPYSPEIKEHKGVKYRDMLTKRGGWYGFTFNPALRRLSDYQSVAPYCSHTTFIRSEASKSEREISRLYHARGYSAGILSGKPYIKHIGGGRHIR